jgi:hypothetical protein
VVDHMYASSMLSRKVTAGEVLCTVATAQISGWDVL